MPERGKPQRGALLRIVTGQDTEPSATIFQVFSATFKTLHEPIFASLASVDFDVDVDARRGRASPRDAANRSGIR